MEKLIFVVAVIILIGTDISLYFASVTATVCSLLLYIWMFINNSDKLGIPCGFYPFLLIGIIDIIVMLINPFKTKWQLCRIMYGRATESATHHKSFRRLPTLFFTTMRAGMAADILISSRSKQFHFSQESSQSTITQLQLLLSLMLPASIPLEQQERRRLHSLSSVQSFLSTTRDTTSISRDTYITRMHFLLR